MMQNENTACVTQKVEHLKKEKKKKDFTPVCASSFMVVPQSWQYVLRMCFAGPW